MKRRSGGFHKAESLLLCRIFFNLHPLASGSAEFDGGFMHLACGGKLGLVEFLETKSLTFYVAVDARRSNGFLDLKYCGGFLRLRHAEIINSGDFAPLFSMAEGATPCCGVLRVTASSTSRPASQCGGPSSVPRRLTSSHRLQVVLSPATAPTAAASSCLFSVEKDRFAFLIHF